MLEIKHLKTLNALAKYNSMRKAADSLFISLSALSHQVKDLESKIGMPLFIRGSTPIEFTVQGQQILTLAENVLPSWQQTERDIVASTTNTYSIGIACHACFQWLIPVIEQVKTEVDGVEFDFTDELFDDRDKVDFLFCDEKPSNTAPHLLGQFELVAVLAKRHPLTKQKYLSAEDFKQSTLLTYPIAQKKMDIFKQLLLPHGIEPKQVKQIKNSHTILQMVCAGVGIAVLPNWLVSTYAASDLISVRPITQEGMFSHMYLSHQESIATKILFEQMFISSKQQFNQLELTLG
ncbi:LysR substrate-binding domain-containing protein [Thalassotalea atypica]|uniref:LysR substrate-binding domain-containing protein n=1 Tax=Thalassotalea atypica TaxID=2054316 RepID=UPI002573CCC7|nr:LysR substrate-binding domain-containing protein [Thalassotalea atypica]